MENKTNLKQYDARFDGKMNPRNTFHCDICKRYYNGTSDTVLMFNDDSRLADCVHGGDTEITETIYEAHMEDLKENNLLEEDFGD